MRVCAALAATRSSPIVQHTTLSAGSRRRVIPLATIVESVARADAGVAVSVAKADRITIAATVTAVLDLPIGVAVRSVPGLVSIP